MPPISDVRCCRPRSGTNGRKSQTYTFKQLKLRLNYDCPRSDSRLSGVDTSEIYVMFGSCFSVAKYSFGSSSCWLTIPVMYVDGHTTCVSFMERHHLSVLFLNSFEFFDRTAILTEDVRPLLLQTQFGISFIISSLVICFAANLRCFLQTRRIRARARSRSIPL
jgi:hypothetical protein